MHPLICYIRIDHFYKVFSESYPPPYKADTDHINIITHKDMCKSVL